MNLFEIKPRDYHTRLRCNRANVRDAQSFLSKSVLWELNDASLWKWRFHPEQVKPTAAMTWGSLIDCLTTTPELEETELALSPYTSFRTTEAKTWKAEQEAQKKTVIDAELLAEGRKAAKMLTETCKATAEIYEMSKKQVIIGGQVLDCNVKGLVDLAPEGQDFLSDLKTTYDFSIAGFAKTTAMRGYHMQAGIYLALWNAMFPNDQRSTFKFIWQDSAPPYEACVRELAQVDIEAGWNYAVKLIERLLEATDSGHWPMAFEGQGIFTRPAWASIQEEAKFKPEEEQL